MKFESRFAEAMLLVWIGTAVGLVLGTAALAVLFPDVPYGVEFVLWTAVLPAPTLLTVWIWRVSGGEATSGDGEPDRGERSNPGDGRDSSLSESMNRSRRSQTVV